VLGVAVLLVAIGGGWYWYANRDLETTDDAYTDGNAITIAPQVSGQVSELAVNDNQFVHAGQVLIRIGPSLLIATRDQAEGQLEAAQGQLDAARAALELARLTYPAKLQAAQAQRDAAQALLSRAQSDLRRQHAVERAATTQQDIDQATAGERQTAAQLAEADANVRQAQPVQQNIDQVAAQVKQLEGQVALARAQLAQAQINLGYATVTAPQDGWVTKRNVDKGNYVAAGSAIMTLVSPQVWVTANFKETQLDRMRAGEPVDIVVDAYPSLKLRGHIDSVQLGSGSKFTAFPPENATGNFVKIVQRVPVKIDIDSGLDPNLPLPLGISAEPTVNLK
jgi:membrane fusion protein (multidrug efflux system)